MTGYEELAVLTARFPELLIVRRFDCLTNRMILALQSELLYLEKEFKIYMDDAETSTDLAGMSASWGKTREAFENGTGELQKEKFEEVQDKLRVYRKCKMARGRTYAKSCIRRNSPEVQQGSTAQRAD